MKKIILLLALFFSFWINQSFAIEENISNTSWNFIIQDSWINWWQSKKITFVWFWNQYAWYCPYSWWYYLDVHQIDNTLIKRNYDTSYCIKAWSTTNQSFELINTINLNNWKYIFIYRSVWLYWYVLFDSNDDTVKWAWNFYNNSTYNSNNLYSYIYYDSSLDKIFLYLWIVRTNTTHTRTKIDIEAFTAINETFTTFSNLGYTDLYNVFNYNYIWWKTIYSKFDKTLWTCYISQTTWNQLCFDIAPTDFNLTTITHLDIVNYQFSSNEMFILYSFVWWNTYNIKIDYNPSNNPYNILNIYENKFNSWVFNWNFIFVDSTSNFVTQSKTYLNKLFLWFTKINNNDLITYFNNTSNLWTIDNGLVIYNYTSWDFFQINPWDETPTTCDTLDIWCYIVNWITNIKDFFTPDIDLNSTPDETLVNTLSWQINDKFKLNEFIKFYNVLLPLEDPILNIDIPFLYLTTDFWVWYNQQEVELLPITDRLWKNHIEENTLWKQFVSFILAVWYIFLRLAIIWIIFFLFNLYYHAIKKFTSSIFWENFNWNKNWNVWSLVFFLVFIVSVVLTFVSILWIILPIFPFFDLIVHILTVVFSYLTFSFFDYYLFALIVNAFFGFLVWSFILYLLYLITLKFLRIN